MSAFERFDSRDLTFSGWHRQALRDIGGEIAGTACGMIDIDCLEYCARCGTNLFLVETAKDVGQSKKSTVQMAKLASASNIPAYCALYAVTGEECTRGQRCRKAGCSHGISAFRMRQVTPLETDWRTLTALEFAVFVLDFHAAHEATVCRSEWFREGAA